jgi:SulP family sulfate permease
MNSSFIKKISINWKAGLTVGLVSIPLAVSLAVAADATPIAGIITAVWAGIMASLTGGSNYNIIGPTGALAGFLMMYSKSFGPECLPMLAILSGLFILLAYFCHLEKYLTFIPGSALHGFILGVATLILLTQVDSIFNIQTLPKYGNPIKDFYNILIHINLIHWPSFLMFLCTFVGLLLFSYILPALPGTIILAPAGIIVGYLCTAKILPWDIPTLGSKYHSIKTALIQIPHFQMHISYIFPAISIATISIIETLVSAKIADGLTKTRHNKRKEVLGLSLANIASGFAGGIPATAALARTALNIKSGATDKVSCAISGVTVALISIFFLGYFQYLPLAVIAGILVSVSVGMLETEHFWYMYRIDKKNLIIALIVAFLTIYEDATIGLMFGAVVAMLLLMQRLSTGYHEIMIKTKPCTSKDEQQLSKEAHTLVYSIKGPFAYINSQAHLAHLESTPQHYTDVILDLRDVHFIDLDGIEAFGEMIQMLTSKNKRVFVSGLNPMVEILLKESHYFDDLIKQHRVFPTTSSILESMQNI